MPITIRLATEADIETLSRHRALMFEEMGVGTVEGRLLMQSQFIAWALPKMQAGLYKTWVACDGEQIVAGAALLHLDWPPNPFGRVEPRLYIYNVYTEHAYRNQGLARQVVQALLDDCKANGWKTVRLHASVFGRHLYETLGFKATNEMQLDFD